MVMRGWPVLALLAPALYGQSGTTPREKPSDYAVHATADGVTIAAEYLVHSLPAGRQTFTVPEYLVVEVACYPVKGKPVTLSGGHFTLRVNGRKNDVRLPQTPGMVAASLKYPDWERRPSLEAGAGADDLHVILGRPQQVERFPGDPRPQRRRLPNPPRVPAGPDIPLERQPVSVEEVVTEAALPEGEAGGPVSGYLYFFHKGKTKSIRSLELIYTAGGRTATLPLF